MVGSVVSALVVLTSLTCVVVLGALAFSAMEYLELSDKNKLSVYHHLNAAD